MVKTEAKIPVEFKCMGALHNFFMYYYSVLSSIFIIENLSTTIIINTFVITCLIFALSQEASWTFGTDMYIYWVLSESFSSYISLSKHKIKGNKGKFEMRRTGIWRKDECLELLNV